jgi:hypothetical protein
MQDDIHPVGVGIDCVPNQLRNRKDRLLDLGQALKVIVLNLDFEVVAFMASRSGFCIQAGPCIRSIPACSARWRDSTPRAHSQSSTRSPDTR